MGEVTVCIPVQMMVILEESLYLVCCCELVDFTTTQHVKALLVTPHVLGEHPTADSFPFSCYNNLHCSGKAFD